jgi:hypothetical protein
MPTTDRCCYSTSTACFSPSDVPCRPDSSGWSSPIPIVVLNQTHGASLSDLAEQFEIVWASTWAATANELIGSRLGLPAFAHIELGTLGTDGTRKLRAVQDFVGDRPFAWVDNELFEDAEAWAAERGVPALLIRTRAYVGLTADHIEALWAFAAEVIRGDR